MSSPSLGAAGSHKRGPERVSERVSDRVALQQTHASDPKYKKYTQQVEKCLASFDNVHEWADFIAFLKQLLKTLQAYMQFKDIPRKITVAKRLAQCLNPALPSGVHQRALDVYTHILAVIGSEGLKRDLALWASGLFPFFEYAATSVKPTLLNLYDTYFLPLQVGLRPVMKGFILALLPGLEEETGEFFDKVLGLLDRLSGTVSPSFFLQNIWLVMLTTPSARGTSINFLSRRLPRLNSDEDITIIVGNDIGLMIRAFAAALEDDNLLVRRGALDLLLQSLRMDSAAFQKASVQDRAILMRAATSVVMRRDLSLNRRLYTWLLGADENSQQQVEYLKKNALELLGSTLRDEMFSPSTEYAESRPFKIFISLLDKWEVGGPLTEVLALDAFKALKRSIEENTESREEVVMTASTLYEAVEPQVVWKQLLRAITSDLTADSTQCEAINLAHFVLTTFHVRDEEIQTVHLPIVFCATMEVLRHQITEDVARGNASVIAKALRLEETLLDFIATAALGQPLDTASKQLSPAHGPHAFACECYALDSSLTLQTERAVPGITFINAFEDLIAISSVYASRLVSAADEVGPVREIFLQSLIMLNQLVRRLDEMEGVQLEVSWEPAKWLSGILATLGNESTTFVVVDQIVTLAVALQDADGLQPSLSIQDRAILFKVVQTLFTYLRSDYSAYHVRAVNLIWELDHACQRPHVESIIAQSLNAPESRNTQEAYEAFGVFWRLTDDTMLPGFRFKVPMMIVLDTLKNDDPNLHRIGETWMRCSLKSYLRVLDPILYDLLDPALRRTPSSTKLNGKELQDYAYERPFDQTYINYLLETLLSVVRFGGQGFAKTARTNLIRRSHHSGLVQRVDAAGVAHGEASYQDVLVEVLTRFLLSECKHRRVEAMAPVNIVIQSATVDLLQAIVARGEVDLLALEGIEAAIIGKLYFSVHTKRLDLQNKLLHLLHSVISAVTAMHEMRLQRTPKAMPIDGSLDGHISRRDSLDSGGPSYSVNPLLIQTLIDGISVPSNHAVLQHWLDFVLMTIPQFQQTLQAVLTPLSDCVGRQLRSNLADIHRVSSQRDHDEDVRSLTTDSDFIMLLHALERLVLLSLSASDVGNAEDDGIAAEKPTPSESSGLLGMMTNVFSSESTPNGPDEQLTTRSPGYRTLHDAVRVLFSIWTTMTWSESEAWTSSHESISLIFTKARLRCRRVFEHLFRVKSPEVMESIVDCWNKEGTPSAAFELVDALTSSAQNVVLMTCESISIRVAGLSLADKSRKHAINPDVSDGVLFTFLEQYLQRLEGPLALQVWSRFLPLAKEVILNVKDFKMQVYPVLRCFSVLADKLTQTTAMEDRRLRKELQDTYGKLLDAVLVSMTRSGDQSSWIRRGTKDSLSVNGRNSPAPHTPSDFNLDEKMNGSTTSLVDGQSAKPSPYADLADQVTQFIAKTALPNLRRYLMDNDKVNTACVNIVYYIVGPSAKGKSRPLDIDPMILDVVRELTRIPVAIKAWRNVVLDILNDNRFFNAPPESGRAFQPVTRCLIDTDRTAFSELLSKVYTAASANIFTNREYENLLRSLNLRRLSYLLLCGEKNQFLTSLPTIQEKLVDVLRNNPAPIVSAEVYLCVRVLLCRLSPHNLVSFWPVILSELYRLFDQMIMSLPSDGSEELPLILAACKFIDLLLILQTEEFQVHQWIFITDTMDAVYRPNDWIPEALLDQLAEIAGQLPVSEMNVYTGIPPSTSTPSAPDARPMRRPMLNRLHQIDSIRDLVLFFSSVSVVNYESVYKSGGSIDFEEVERGLVADMFDGR